MIDLLLKDNKIHTVRSASDITGELSDFLVAQFHSYTQADIDWSKKHFGLDFSIMDHYEDIEISSHFLEHQNQISFHFSIPYYREKRMVEEPIFIMMSAGRLFFFESSDFDAFINETYPYRLSAIQQSADPNNTFKLWISFISDYYADITENLAAKIKELAGRVLIDKKFRSEDMNIVTQCNFNNLLVKESVNGSIRIYHLLKKSDFGKKIDIADMIDAELDDLAVVSDYIQFNFERLDDLKDNINHRVDLEQNYIFKILTIITLCIALPTLVAGIYGMNFEVMPELKWAYGYPLTIVIMVLSAVLPYLYFKRKKWLK